MRTLLRPRSLLFAAIVIATAIAAAGAVLLPSREVIAQPQVQTTPEPTPYPTDYPYSCPPGDIATILGGGGPDVLFGTLQRDVIASLGGNDFVFGSAGDDLICNGGFFVVGGNDIFIGGRGNDSLLGQTGHDILIGGPGDDYLEGGYDPRFETFNICIGGPGEDTFAYCDVAIQD